MLHYGVPTLIENKTLDENIALGAARDIFRITEQELYGKMGFPENWRKITRYRNNKI